MLRAKQFDQCRSEKLAPAMDDLIREPFVRLNVNVPKSMYRALKTKAVADDVSISDLVKLWVTEYLSKSDGNAASISMQDK